jgi:hypothetical protein
MKFRSAVVSWQNLRFSTLLFWRGKSIETPQSRCHVLGRRLMTFSTQKFDWKSRKISEILTKTNSKEDCATQVQ